MFDYIAKSLFDIFILILFFLLGCCVKNTYLSLPDSVKKKIEVDSNDNYRTTDCQIRYIITEYYKDK